MAAQAHVAGFYPSASVPPAKDQDSESDSKMAERVNELELWRENLNQTRKRRSDQPTELERATKVVLSGLGREKLFDPFEWGILQSQRQKTKAPKQRNKNKNKTNKKQKILGRCWCSNDQIQPKPKSIKMRKRAGVWIGNDETQPTKPNKH